MDEAIRLLDALAPEDRALWGCAFWAALRHGEAKALLWSDVDLSGGMLSIRASWDQHEGRVDPKSRSGVRRVPIIGRLHDLLAEHRALTGRTDGLVFGRTDSVPFQSATVNAMPAGPGGWPTSRRSRSTRPGTPLLPSGLQRA